ncbi:MAG: hypothetical protein DPW09_13955 [Anaerolineae bacterium]|nr:hypothetical protein [Anaerolineales bacterium]MCQ3974541.1 hypothetical protein [Anaerolineae bacterium]
MSESSNQPSWYKLESPAVLSHLGSDATHGLSEAEAARRLTQYGPNELIEQGAKSPWRILWEQFTATMVVILIIASLSLMWPVIGWIWMRTCATTPRPWIRTRPPPCRASLSLCVCCWPAGRCATMPCSKPITAQAVPSTPSATQPKGRW